MVELSFRANALIRAMESNEKGRAAAFRFTTYVAAMWALSTLSLLWAPLALCVVFFMISAAGAGASFVILVTVHYEKQLLDRELDREVSGRW